MLVWWYAANKQRSRWVWKMHKLVHVGLILIFFLAACKPETKSFSGYVDADLVYLSADFGGRLVDLPIQRGQLVNPKQFLFKLEQTSELYQVNLSKSNSKDLDAQREQIVVQLSYNQINYHRTLGMRKQSAASQNDLDTAQRDLKVSQQQLVSINDKILANRLDIANKIWEASRKESFAPEFGLIFDTYYTKGEFVQAGYPVLSLITKDKIKAVFFVSEAQLDKIKLNSKIKITSDNNPNFATGHIFYISNIAEYTPPIIYSREERQRLVFRVEAKIDTPNLEKVHLGQPVTLELA